MLKETMFTYLVRAMVLVTAIPIHECAHAWASDKLGDPTAKNLGRLTLNPLPHLDVFGSILMIFTGFGWAKPVPVNPGHFKKPKRDMALTALAGPTSNVLLALLLMVIFKVYMFYGNIGSTVGLMFGQIIYTILWTNLTLAVFNLLPVPPLDGAKILNVVLPFSFQIKIRKYEKYFYVALVLLLYLGFLQIPLHFLGDMLFRGLNWATAPVDLLLQMIGG